MCEYNFTKGIPNASCIECLKLPMTKEQRRERYMAGLYINRYHSGTNKNQFQIYNFRIHDQNT